MCVVEVCTYIDSQVDRFVFLSFFLFYLFGREREREGEPGFPVSPKPDVGLNPRTLGSYMS